MFEAVVSYVKSGRVERTLFETRSEAEQYLTAVEERLVNPPMPEDPTQRRPKPKSRRAFRTEIHVREAATIVAVPEKTKRQKVAA